MKYLMADLQTKLQGIGIPLKIDIIAAIFRLKDTFGPQSPNEARIPRGIGGPPELLDSHDLGKTSVLQKVRILYQLVNFAVRAEGTDPAVYPAPRVPSSGSVGEALERSLTAGHRPV
jgi:hypothetical protein